MKRLVEINPEEIMAHSNLSVYYMQQGRIEDAEREKGEATALQFEKAIAENMAKKITADKAKQDLTEIGQGNLNTKVPEIKTDKDMEVLNKNFNSMINRLKNQQEKLHFHIEKWCKSGQVRGSIFLNLNLSNHN